MALTKEQRTEILEKIAAVQHDAWQHWAEEVASEVSEERRARWEEFFVPYDQLDETTKDMDREWAEKVMEVLGPILDGGDAAPSEDQVEPAVEPEEQEEDPSAEAAWAKDPKYKTLVTVLQSKKK